MVESKEVKKINENFRKLKMLAQKIDICHIKIYIDKVAIWKNIQL